MTEEQEYQLWRTFIYCFAIVLVTLIATVAIYNIADRYAPVRPYLHQEYSWPTGTPSK